jgi:hypothetical protein
MNGDFLKAASDLRQGSGTGYTKAENELTYLGNLPVTNVPSAQQAKASADVKALDSFFGTPGLLSS